MRKKTFIDRDLKGQIIDQKTKDSKSVEIDGNAKFAGHRFLLKQKLYGDKRCLYCGRWFHWQATNENVLRWFRDKNIYTMNYDNVVEPLHCESLHCQEYHHLWLKEVERRREIGLQHQTWRLFKDLQNKGAVK